MNTDIIEFYKPHKSCPSLGPRTGVPGRVEDREWRMKMRWGLKDEGNENGPEERKDLEMGLREDESGGRWVRTSVSIPEDNWNT